MAKRLLQEDFFEDAVSRAYYAMYHAARACLVLEGSAPKTHAGLISEFGRLFVLPGRVVPDDHHRLGSPGEDVVLATFGQLDGAQVVSPAEHQGGGPPR